MSEGSTGKKYHVGEENNEQRNLSYISPFSDASIKDWAAAEALWSFFLSSHFYHGFLFIFSERKKK
jgi:actin-related protein